MLIWRLLTSQLHRTNAQVKLHNLRLALPASERCSAHAAGQPLGAAPVVDAADGAAGARGCLWSGGSGVPAACLVSSGAASVQQERWTVLDLILVLSHAALSEAFPQSLVCLQLARCSLKQMA